MRRALWAAGLTLLATVGLAVPPAEPAGPPRVHAVLAGDTADRAIGSGCRADLDRVRDLLAGGTQVHPSRVGTVTTLAGDGASAANILKAVADLPSRAEDAVLVYVSAHGGFDPADADPVTGGHFLVLRARGGSDLRRADLRRALADRPGRLRLLVTDACHERRKRVPAAEPSGPPAAGAPVPPAVRPKVVSAVERLLFAHTGRLDVNAAGPHEQAVGMERDGGLFTLALTARMTRPGTWAGVLADAGADARRAVPGHTQTVRVFENTVRPAEPAGGLAPLLDEPPAWGLPGWWAGGRAP